MTINIGFGPIRLTTRRFNLMKIHITYKYNHKNNLRKNCITSRRKR